MIADALQAAFDDPLGCACVCVDGSVVAEARGERWPQGGIAHVASVTKPAAVSPRMTAPDLVLGEERTWSAGFAIDIDDFGMGGLGGSLGWADPDKGLAFGYVTAALGSHARAEAVYEAVAAALG